MSILAGKKSLLQRSGLGLGGLDGENVGQILCLAVDRKQVLLIDLVAGKVHLTGDVPAVDVPGALSGHRLQQFLVKGAQLLAGQQFPLTQQGVNGAHGVGGGKLVQKSFLSGDNGEGDLGELAVFLRQMEGGRFHARVEYKDIGIGLVPLPVRAQFFARRVGSAGVGQQVIVVAGKFLRGKRPMVPGGSRHQSM